MRNIEKILRDFLGGPVVKNLPPNAGDAVRSLLWEDSVCLGATKVMRHNYGAHALEPWTHICWAHVLHLMKPACPRACTLQQEKWKHSSFRRVQLCNPMDCSPPGSSVHGILQARILERVVIPFSRGSFWPRDWTWVSCSAGRFFAVWATGETQD